MWSGGKQITNKAAEDSEEHTTKEKYSMEEFPFMSFICKKLQSENVKKRVRRGGHPLLWSRTDLLSILVPLQLHCWVCQVHHKPDFPTLVYLICRF